MQTAQARWRGWSSCPRTTINQRRRKGEPLQPHQPVPTIAAVEWHLEIARRALGKLLLVIERRHGGVVPDRATAVRLAGLRVQIAQLEQRIVQALMGDQTEPTLPVLPVWHHPGFKAERLSRTRRDGDTDPADAR